MSRRLILPALVAGFFIALCAVASASWSGGVTGQGVSKAATVNAGNAPSATVTSRTAQLTWAASTLSTGVPVTGYLIRRYNTGTTQQAINSGTCAAIVSGTSCTETSLPAGTWRYSVTPTVNAWRGTESTLTSVSVSAPSMTLSPSQVKSPSTLSGSISNFIAGETITFRLDTLTGTVLTGSLNGTATPTAYPSGASATAVVNMPAGVADGAHTIYAVASPSGENASFAVTVDDVAPPAPSISGGPASPTTSTSASFSLSDTEGGVTYQCQLDAGGYSACSSPKAYAGLSEGSHIFYVKARDAAGNDSVATAFTWTVDVSPPSIAIAFPVASSSYNGSGYDAGCGTSGTGDVCGTAADTYGVANVQVSVLQVSTGKYWSGAQFLSGPERLQSVSGTTSWTYALAASALSDGSYSLRALATDLAGRTTSATTTFTIDTVVPPTPTIGSAPAFTNSAATFSFTDIEAGVTYQCQLDSGGYSTCASPKTYSGLSAGSHTFLVKARDPAGNDSLAASFTWTVDTASPTAPVTFAATGSSYNTAGFNSGCGTPSTGDVCGTAADTGGAGVQKVKVSFRQGSGNYWNGTSFSSASEVLFDATGTASWSYAFPGSNFPAGGSYTVRAVATDNATNTGSSSSTFTIDTTAPAGSDVQSTNAVNPPGANAGKAQATDSITFTYTEAMLPGSILTGWTGASSNVVVRINDGVAGNDTLQVWNAANASQLPLGTVDLGHSDYVTASVTFGATGTASTMVQSGNTITVTLGTVSNGLLVTQTASNGVMLWTPSASATDLAGNAAATTVVTESGSPDKEF